MTNNAPRGARTTTKAELVSRVTARCATTKTRAADIIDGFLNEVAVALLNGRRVELRRFGVFDVVERAPRRGMNPKTGEAIEIPRRHAVSFTTGSALANAVQSEFDEES